MCFVAQRIQRLVCHQAAARPSVCATFLEALPWCWEFVAAVVAGHLCCTSSMPGCPRPRRDFGSGSGFAPCHPTCSWTQSGKLEMVTGHVPALFHAHQATALSLQVARGRASRPALAQTGERRTWSQTTQLQALPFVRPCAPCVQLFGDGSAFVRQLHVCPAPHRDSTGQ